MMLSIFFAIGAACVCAGVSLVMLARAKGTRHTSAHYGPRLVIGAEDDDIEALMDLAEEEVAGLERVGQDVPDPGRRAGLQRQQRELVKRRPLGFAPETSNTVAAGATETFTATAKRGLRVNRLLVSTTAAGIVINSIKMGDVEQVLTPGVAAEAYGPDALTDSVPDNFDAIAANTEVTIEVENPTASPIDVTVAAKCAVLSTGA